MGKNKEKTKERVEEYLKLPYTIKLIKEEDGTYYVSVEELPGCATMGDTLEEAMAMIKEAMEGWIESNLERGLEIPLPESMKEYSGKFLVRVPASLHRRLVEQAKKEGVSLNQLVVSLLSEKITLKEIKEELIREISMLEKSPNV
jgi:predicted RNase H-like HicB family nuclease